IAIAAGAARWYFIQAAVPSVPVLVAKTELTPGTLITEDNLAVVEMPRSALPKDRITHETYELVIGTHARTWVAAGDPVRLAHLSELRLGGGTLAALTALEDPKLRGYVLPSDAVDGLNLEPGDRVDLVGVMDTVAPVEGQQGQTTRSQLIVQDAPVLFVAAPDYEAPYQDVLVTVGLTPRQAEKVALFEIKGSLKAQVRPAHGGENVSVSGVDTWTVFQREGE
ncbi:MAG: Flp pilus assembly protein CpaB, partial [Candidatus Desulforudis sp.]|nr:Flp pilus assembly protein CpaB [Desulforudis sp.]